MQSLLDVTASRRSNLSPSAEKPGECTGSESNPGGKRIRRGGVILHARLSVSVLRSCHWALSPQLSPAVSLSLPSHPLCIGARVVLRLFLPRVCLCMITSLAEDGGSSRDVLSLHLPLPLPSRLQVRSGRSGFPYLLGKLLLMPFELLLHLRSCEGLPYEIVCNDGLPYCMTCTPGWAAIQTITAILHQAFISRQGSNPDNTPSNQSQAYLVVTNINAT